MSEMLWLAVPGGAIGADGAVLRVLAVPRLSGAGPDLQSYGLADWPARLAAATFTVQTGTDPAGTGTSVTGAQRVDHVRPELWAKMFPAALPVRPYLPPPPRRPPDVDPSATHSKSVTSIYVTSARAPGDAATVSGELAGADLGVSPPPPTIAAAAVPAAGPDFHRVHSLLREHPAVLEALGLIVEFRLPAPAALAQATLVRVQCALDGFDCVSPWTKYTCTATRFLAAPADGSDLAAGMVDLSAAHWQFATFDVTNGVQRLRDAAGAAAAAGRADGPASPAVASLPALRSAGLSLLREDRASQLGTRVAAANGRGTLTAGSVLTAEDLVLGYRVDVRQSDGDWLSLMRRSAVYQTADGEQITDAGHQEEGQVKPHGMTVSDQPANPDPATDLRTFRADEVVTRWDGWSLAVPRSLDRPVRRSPASQIQLPFLRWTFQAMAMPALRFGRRYRMRVRVADFAGGGLDLADPDLTEAQSAEVFYGRHDPIPPPVLASPAALLSPPPGPVAPTDPGAPDPGAPDPGAPDPGAPGPAALGPGGAVDVLVIRSDPLSGTTPDHYAALYPANDRRMVLPPPGSFALAEQHKKLDGAEAPVAAGWLRRALTPQQYATDGTYSWLPDPAAEGIAMYIQPAPGTQSPGSTTKEAWTVPDGAWPDLPGKTIVLSAVAGDQPTLDWTSQGHVGEVRLAAGRQVTVELSSTVVTDDVDNFEMKNWLTFQPEDNRHADGRPLPPLPPGLLEQVLEAVYNGRHPMVSPPQVVRLVHAVQRPVRTPAGTLAAARDPGSTVAVIADPALPLLSLDPPSTAQVDLAAVWDEITDDVTTPVPRSSIAVARLEPDAAALPALTHEFADTRHRMVDYTLTATSRFRPYFTDDPAHTGDAQFQAPPLVQRVNVPSTARPPVPDVRSVTPAFRWTGRELPDGWQQLDRVRAGGVVRVELGRPWHRSGDGELLAVLVADPSGTTDVHHYVSTAHRDPIWATPPVTGMLRTDMFGGLAAGDAAVPLSETGDLVRAVPFAAHFVPDRDGRPAHWYADIEIPVTAAESYSPFVRLALARYQPSSLPGLEVSPVVRADPVQLLPERHLTVTRAAGSVTVLLSGPGPLIAQDAELGADDRPDMPMANHVLAYLERLPGQAGHPPLSAVAAGQPVGWQRVPGALGSDSMTERPVGGDFTGVVRGAVTLSLPPGSEPLRLVVREIEWFPGAPSIVASPADEVHERTVFADVIPLR